MSFDQDPNEQAQISGADFAQMCDEMKRLQDALAYWLPDMPEKDHPLSDRIAKDVYLLCGIDGNNDEPSAYARGLIALIPDADRLRSLNAHFAG